MKKIVFIWSVTVFLANLFSVSYEQQTINKFHEPVAINLEPKLFMADPNQALIETMTDTVNVIDHKISLIPNANKLESKADLADPNLDLNITNSEYLLMLTNYKRDAEENILKNENCLFDLYVRILNQKGVDSAIFRGEVELLDQRNAVLKIRLADFYLFQEPEGFITFKNSFDEDLESVTNALLDLTVNVKK